MKPLPDGPYTCLITPGEAHPSNFEIKKTEILETIRDAVADGVNLIQIREKALPARLLFHIVSDAVQILSSTEALVLVNDRVDVAIAARADGVHLPEVSLMPDVVRRVIASDLVIGVSTHSIEQALTAADSCADYIFFGPIFETPGKGVPVGIESLSAVCRELKTFPVIALGGVDQNNFENVLSAGAAGIAAIRSLNDQATRRAICERL
ncbi:MAG: thiamine phosphate synthase [Acidobacteriota bacterium]